MSEDKYTPISSTVIGAVEETLKEESGKEEVLGLSSTQEVLTGKTERISSPSRGRRSVVYDDGLTDADRERRKRFLEKRERQKVAPPISQTRVDILEQQLKEQRKEDVEKKTIRDTLKTEPLGERIKRGFGTLTADYQTLEVSTSTPKDFEVFEETQINVFTGKTVVRKYQNIPIESEESLVKLDRKPTYEKRLVGYEESKGEALLENAGPIERNIIEGARGSARGAKEFIYEVKEKPAIAITVAAVSLAVGVATKSPAIGAWTGTALAKGVTAGAIILGTGMSAYNVYKDVQGGTETIRSATAKQLTKVAGYAGISYVSAKAGQALGGLVFSPQPKTYPAKGYEIEYRKSTELQTGEEYSSRRLSQKTLLELGKRDETVIDFPEEITAGYKKTYEPTQTYDSFMSRTSSQRGGLPYPELQRTRELTITPIRKQAMPQEVKFEGYFTEKGEYIEFKGFQKIIGKKASQALDFLGLLDDTLTTPAEDSFFYGSKTVPLALAGVTESIMTPVLPITGLGTSYNLKEKPKIKPIVEPVLRAYTEPGSQPIIDYDPIIEPDIDSIVPYIVEAEITPDITGTQETVITTPPPYGFSGTASPMPLRFPPFGFPTLGTAGRSSGRATRGKKVKRRATGSIFQTLFDIETPTFKQKKGRAEFTGIVPRSI